MKLNIWRLSRLETKLFACADFELLRWRRSAWGEWKSLSGSQHRDFRPMSGIRRACRTIGPIECVHELRAIRHLAGSGGRRALRPLSAVHGRNIACRRNSDSDPESAGGQAGVDFAFGFRTSGPGSNAGSSAHPESESCPQRRSFRCS